MFILHLWFSLQLCNSRKGEVIYWQGLSVCVCLYLCVRVQSPCLHHYPKIELDDFEEYESPGTDSIQTYARWHFSLVQFSHSVISNSLWPHGLQHTRLPCLSPTPGACSNSCPLSQWYYPTISSSVIPLSSCLQSFTASGSFVRSQFFASGGQSIRASASASVLPMNIQDWFSTGWTGLIL